MTATLRLLPLAALGLAMAAWAGPLADPTRPPTMAAPANAAAPTASTGPRPTAAAPRAPTAAAVAPLLQSLQVSARGPSSAMVDGQVVQVGDRVGGRLVLAIDHDGLLLRATAGTGAGTVTATERLTLLPGATKQAAGSISINRVAGYAPAASAAAEASQGADAASAPARERPADDTATSPQPSPLSLAGRSKP